MKERLLAIVAVSISFVALVAVCPRTIVALFEPGIYIRPDGSIVSYPIDGPPPIKRDGDVYTLTADNVLTIIVQRSNIVLDGDGYRQGAYYWHNAINVSMVANITIRDFIINAGYYTGIYSVDCSFINIASNIFSINGVGIALNRSQNNVVRSNSFQSNDIGIRMLGGCYDTVVAENSFFNGQFAAMLEGDCDYNQIVNNTIRETSRSGIYVDGWNKPSPSNCVMSGNVIINAWNGISVYDSSAVNISENVFEKSGLVVYESDQNTVLNNTVNGKPLVYLEDTSDYTVEDAGQVILINCNNMIVQNSNLSYSCIGVGFWNTTNSRIANNNIASNSDLGVELLFSYNNTIAENNIDANAIGVRMRQSTENTIVDNTIRANGDGIDIDESSDRISIIQNNIEANTVGIGLSNSLNGTIYHNNFINNTEQASVNAPANIWDNGYPSGGNYWSDYTGLDADQDGLGDLLYPYVLDGNNRDRYPFMDRPQEFNATSEQTVQVICNSSISNFQFIANTIRFNASGEMGDHGFCRICFPTELMNDTYHVFVNGIEIPFRSLPPDATYSYLCFNYVLNSSVTQRNVLLKTNMGDILIRLYDDMPITTANFMNLTRMGIYDNTIFHRVIENFIIQGGDPTGTGYGDPSISPIPDELPNLHSNVRGSVAMAKTSEPNSATSQFFINLVDNSESLDSTYVVFGEVIAGMDVVDAISRVPTDSNNKPLQQVTVTEALLIEYTTAEVVILPEFPMQLFPSLLMLEMLLAIAVCKRKRSKRALSV